MTKRWKSTELDYAFIAGYDDIVAIPVCLTWRERQILLSLIDPIGWETRWTGEPDKDQIENWRDELLLKLSGACAVDCDDVWVCLGITPGDFTALLDWLLQQLQGEGDVIEILIDGGDGTGNHPAVDEVMIDSCDNDQLFAFCKQLVQFIDRMITDLYEVLELKTDILEYMRIITKEVPYVGKSLDYVEELLDSYVDSYLAGYDQELEDDYACALMCIALENDCQLTWRLVMDYFLERAEYELGDNDVADLLAYYVTGIWSGDEPVHIAFGTLAAVLYFGGKYLGLDLTGIQRIWAAILNDSDSDWETLCTGCVWTYEADFTTVDNDWVIDTDFAAENQGQYVASTGWQTTSLNWGVGGDDTSRAVCISLPIIADSVITRMTMTYDLTNSGNWDGSGVHNHVVVRTPSQILKEVNSPTDNSGSGKTLYYNESMDVAIDEEIVITVVSGRHYQDTDPGGQVTITGITMRGVGDNPFIA